MQRKKCIVCPLVDFQFTMLQWWSEEKKNQFSKDQIQGPKKMKTNMKWFFSVAAALSYGELHTNWNKKNTSSITGRPTVIILRHRFFLQDILWGLEKGWNCRSTHVNLLTEFEFTFMLHRTNIWFSKYSSYRLMILVVKV
jgi:hypothetical protein